MVCRNQHGKRGRFERFDVSFLKQRYVSLYRYLNITSGTGTFGSMPFYYRYHQPQHHYSDSSWPSLSFRTDPKIGYSQHSLILNGQILGVWEQCVISLALPGSEPCPYMGTVCGPNAVPDSAVQRTSTIAPSANPLWPPEGSRYVDFQGSVVISP